MNDKPIAESAKFYAECPECEARTEQIISVYADRQDVYCFAGRHTLRYGPRGPKKDAPYTVIYAKAPESTESSWKEDFDTRRTEGYYPQKEVWKTVQGDDRQRRKRGGKFNYYVDNVRINPANPSPAPDEGDEKDG